MAGVTLFYFDQKWGVALKLGTILAQAPGGDWLLFADPCDVLCAYDHAEVRAVLAAVDTALADKLHVAGFIGYEAAGAMDSALETHAPDGFPLAWFGVYAAPARLAELPAPDAAGAQELDWQPDTDRASYGDAIRRIRDLIRAGDTYQVNYTMRLRSRFSGDAYAFFVRLCRAQDARYAVFGDLGDWAVCSASPELFFETCGAEILTRPMKGTAPRGLTVPDDQLIQSELAGCTKNRAENVMIVDMIRNDLGRIAEPGSVIPDPLFEVERYPTLFQMVSTVRARTQASFSQTVRALFPCASITGAPKVRTMQIIKELESRPRHFYTGMAGYCTPDGFSRFNVMIRTVTVDKRAGMAEYGVGGGIVWDSVEQHEYDECLTKAAVLTHAPPAFELLETLRYAPGEGYAYLAAHIARAAASAQYWGYAFDAEHMQDELDQAVAGKCVPQRVRWLLARDGSMRVESVDLQPLPQKPVGVAAVGSCRRGDVFLYHKTTQRPMYEAALAQFPDCGDVILVNEDGEITESCLGNVVFERGGVRYTPPVDCGLLDGTMRRALVESGEVVEARLRREDLLACDQVWLINSVRGWMPVAEGQLQFTGNSYL
jgi:para-aminobenzoate synthetase / 4-amino-4-deoxychorismate lyase